MMTANTCQWSISVFDAGRSGFVGSRFLECFGNFFQGTLRPTRHFEIGVGPRNEVGLFSNLNPRLRGIKQKN